MMSNTKIKAVADINESPYQVQVLDRALGILDSLSKDGPELGPAELSEKLDLHKSTVHRLLMVLERHGLIERGPQNGKYRLGMKLFELGSQAVAKLNLRERAQPYLERLVAETGETAHICVLNGDSMLSIINVESPHTLRSPSTVGQRTPLHCTSVGKTLLAFLPEDEAEQLIKKCELRRYTSRTLTTRARLKAELKLIRRRGYAMDNGEIEEGLRCLGAPVWDYSGKIVAALSIAGPAFRLTEVRIPAVSQAVLDAAKNLSQELGYTQGLTQNGKRKQGEKT
jgi:DNA-binding IclR family transcriptional regulator